MPPPPFSTAKPYAPRAYLPGRRRIPRHGADSPMLDLIWLAVLAGLFLLTLAFVRLCDAA